MSSTKDEIRKKRKSAFSRRGFLQGLGAGTGVIGTGLLTPEQAEAAAAGQKAMMPFGRPFLDYVLSGLADAGYTDICLVVGPDHDAVREYYTRKRPPRPSLPHFPPVETTVEIQGERRCEAFFEDPASGVRPGC